MGTSDALLSCDGHGCVPSLKFEMLSLAGDESNRRADYSGEARHVAKATNAHAPALLKSCLPGRNSTISREPEALLRELPHRLVVGVLGAGNTADHRSGKDLRPRIN